MPRHKITQSSSPNWRTPGWLRDAVRAEFPLMLDVCADARPGTPLCPRWLGPGSLILDDALCGIPWVDILHEEIVASAAESGHLVVPAQLPSRSLTIWCNPPYSKTHKHPIEPWVEQCAIAGQSITAVALLPHAHQTKWWAAFVESPDPTLRAAEVRPFPFRIAFDPPPDYSGVPTGSNVNHALVIWSPHTAAFREPWIPARHSYDPRPAPVRRHRRPRPARPDQG